MRHLLVLFLISISFITILSCGIGGSNSSSSESTDSVPISPSSGVANIKQTVYTFPGITQSQSLSIKQVEGIYTGVGFIEIDTSKLINMNLGTVVFINVFVDNLGWVIENQLLPLEQPMGLLGIEFAMHQDPLYNSKIDKIKAKVLVTSQPLSEFNPSALDEWVVTERQYNAEGFGDSEATGPPLEIVSSAAQKLISYEINVDNLVSEMQNLAQNAGKNRVRFGELTGDNFKFAYCFQVDAHKYNIQAARNQCAPAGVANSLAWLKDKWGTNVPHEHKAGLRGDNTLVGKLGDAMERQIALDRNRRVGNGVPPAKLINGKLKYIRNNNICLVVKHQTTHKEIQNDVTYQNLTSKYKGTPTFEFICKEICKGQDVELGFKYASGGGHIVKANMCAVSVVNGKKKFEVGFFHDEDQSDDTKGTVGGVLHLSTPNNSGIPVEIQKNITNGKLIKGTIKLVITESPPAAEGKTVKEACSWLPQDDTGNPKNVSEKCSGVEHDIGFSRIWVCLNGQFEPGEYISLEFPGTNPGSWSYEITEASQCICSSYQEITSYGTYSYSGVYVTTDGNEQSLSGQIQVDSSSRPCSCP